MSLSRIDEHKEEEKKIVSILFVFCIERILLEDDNQSKDFSLVLLLVNRHVRCQGVEKNDVGFVRHLLELNEMSLRLIRHRITNKSHIEVNEYFVG